MQAYRKKPVIIHAMQFDSSPQSAHDIIEEALKHGVEITCEHDGGESHVLKIPTLEGVMTASPGDYIIRGVKGEFYPCKPDIFWNNHEQV